MKIGLNEVFLSIQGEGLFTGTVMVFVRFAGCNRTCSFCNTDHTQKRLVPVPQLAREIRAYGCSHVCITGGEPFLQQDALALLIPHLPAQQIHVETNGSIEPYANVRDSVWLTVSPKGETALTDADEVKVVVPFGGAIPDIDSLPPARYYWLQPQDGSEGSVTWTANLLMTEPSGRWRLSVQTHKLNNIQLLDREE